MNDFVVVGSGPSGVHAAQTLVEGGRKVCLLDVGLSGDHHYADKIPDQSFLEIRHGDKEQGRYFLGDEYEGIPIGQIRAGSTLSAPRQFATSGLDKWAPSRNTGFQPVESLARGGLGVAWGLGCFVMSDAELRQMGLNHAQLKEAYQRVADRIGISGPDAADSDDCSAHYRRFLTGVQPPLDLDENAERLLAAYSKRRARLNAKRIYVGRTMLGLLSRPKDGRRENQYFDMDFWSDRGQSAYRPAVTLDRLQKTSSFEYRSGALVLSFSERQEQGVRIEYFDIHSREKKEIHARGLILAAGVFGTARIVLRSAGRNERLPFLCNPYYYAVCLHTRLLGKQLRDHRHSMGQLVLLHDERGDQSHVPMISLLSYRSFLLHRLIKEAPIAATEGRRLMQYLQSALVIGGVFHPDYPSEARKELRLTPDSSSPTGDALAIHYELTRDERARISRNQKEMLRALRTLGCIPLRVVNPGHGASVHYGGSLPFDTEGSLSTDSRSGLLGGHSRVFVADGSPFRTVPAKGITLTLMAYADWVGNQALRMTP